MQKSLHDFSGNNRNMFTFALRATYVRPKIVSIEPVAKLGNGHYRSVPKSVDSPVPSKKAKPVKFQEKPTGIETSGYEAEPAREPENSPTLEPVSRRE
jgi:hypothetical protein